eukprot:m.238880 g.238880  ORF g.238880 m.238880 type:complete len:113 (-) comp33732_c0_seq1:1256-1594(-)
MRTTATRQNGPNKKTPPKKQKKQMTVNKTSTKKEKTKKKNRKQNDNKKQRVNEFTHASSVVVNSGEVQQRRDTACVCTTAQMPCQCVGISQTRVCNTAQATYPSSSTEVRLM